MTENKPENPPAFAASATSLAGDVYHQEGATLRDYFAAKAPKNIPFWFKCNFASEPQYPCLEELPEELRSEAQDWLSDPIFDFSFEHGIKLVEFQARHEMARIAHEAWETECRKIRYFSWRYYYADAMLKARES